MDLIVTWAQFLVCAAVIWFAGMRVSRYGDLIAEKTGASRTWIGVVLMASVTSLPELFTGISSVRFAMTPNIAIGDILGSCVFNLLILTLVDILRGHTLVFTEASRGHVLTAAFGIVLLGTVAVGLTLGNLGFDLSVGHFGWSSVAIVVLYFIAMRGVFRYEMEQMVEQAAETTEEEAGTLTLRDVVVRYVGWAAVVVAAAVWLPFVGEHLARAMGWGHSFVGNLFIAFATSLPEIVVTIGCVRQGATDLAIGNVLGSNLFNILILAIDDFLYLQGPLFSAVERVNLMSAMTGILMSAVAIIGLLYRPRTRLFGILGWISASLILLYLVNTFVLFSYRNG